ncbi:MAG: aspartate aminotransferase family protein [Chloroflexi bacterium]|nr:aspartate aminotransferase family protein [Chloroflexota bacterium]
MRIPENGLSRSEVLDRLEAYRQHDLDWQGGRVFAYVYDPGEDVRSVVKTAYGMYLSENGLDPTTTPSVLQMEREVVRAIINLQRGDENVVGNMTSGGTESIMLAVKAARDYARATRGISEPAIVLSNTTHAAFHKAAAYLGLDVTVVPCDPDTLDVDIEGYRAAITENTVLLVVSAPNYSHGIIEDVPAVAALAAEHDLLCHVDACVGGIMLAYMRDDYDFPAYDWTVPGVTSISTDLHKYGYAAKGASVIMYRSKALRRSMIWASAATTGYPIINPTVQSTRSGGPKAGAWAALNYLGDEGYRKLTRDVMEATRRIREGIDAIAELTILGDPGMCLLAFSSDALNVYQLADAMKKRGWYIQPQFSNGPIPRNVHITVQHSSAPHVDEFLAALRASVEDVKALPPIDEDQINAMLQPVIEDFTPERFSQLTAFVGMDGGSLPEDLALINTILDLLPAPMAEQFLIEFFNELYV